MMKKCKQELFVKGAEIFIMFGDFYNLNKLLMNGDENGLRTDAYFEFCAQKEAEFCKKHPSRYAGKLARTLLEELETRWKEEKEEAGTAA